MPSSTIEHAGLGRIAQVGDLYDARSDKFTGNSLLKKDASQKIFHVTENSFTDVQFVLSDTFADKTAKFNIDTELQVSVLCELLTVEGSGKYLKNEKESCKAVRGSLIHTLQTKVEQLNLSSDEFKDFCDLNLIDNRATHFVVKVIWGARSVVTIEYANHEKSNINDVKEDLQVHLNSLVFPNEKCSNMHSGKTGAVDCKKCLVHTFTDVVPNDKLPQSYEEALGMMKKLPVYLAESNNGKGQPLTFMLMLTSELKHFLAVPAEIHFNAHFQQLNNKHWLTQFVKLFDEVFVLKQALHDLIVEMEEHEMCVTKDDFQLPSKALIEFNASVVQLKVNIATALVNIRSGVAGVEQLDTLKGELQVCLLKVAQVQKDCSKLIEKMALVDFFTKKGVTFVGLGSSLEILQKNDQNDVYVLCYSQEYKKKNVVCWNKNKTFFCNLVDASKMQREICRYKGSTKPQYEKTMFFVLDVDLRPELMQEVKMEKSIRIYLYKNGKCVNRDVLQSNSSQQMLCFAHATERGEKVQNIPPKLKVLSICCPGSIAGACPTEELAWLCDKCNKHIQYGTDGHFYCKCSGNSRLFATRYTFKCNSAKHGYAFIAFDKQALWPLLTKVKPSNNYLNILILGESGVGKSTWINAIANYTTFASLEEAKGSEPMSLIGASFTVMDDNLEEKVISIGDDANESFKTGQSATQDPKAYLFNWKGTSVRLIDTPGIGDTRGIDQDKANFEAILKFLSELKEIHGICILLKPNNARLAVMFRFCIKELLTHLHRSCSNNIVFCFTNARNTFYKPGDTFPALKQLLLENKEVEIALSKDTIYCMDNESFRYLCMIHHDVVTDESEVELYSTSWEKSVTETNRLLGYIKTLKPHVVQDTISINDTRRIIVNFTKPIASISQNIQANIAVIEDKKREIKCSTERIENLKKKLYVPGIDLIAVPLGYPRTVCTSPTCVKYHTIEKTNLTKIEYVTHCHAHCNLIGVKPESYPNPDLLGCDAMAGTQNCTQCCCPWSKHMHITYDQVHQSQQVIDVSIENQINSKRSDSEKIELFIKELEDRQKALQGEQTTIRKACAKFSTFLMNNAILTYNNALAEYLDVLIKQEKEKCQSDSDRLALEGLETMRQEYLEEVATFQMAVQSGNNAGCLSIVEINRLVKTLYSLPLKGAELKQHMEIILKSKSRMVSYNETCCYPTYKRKQKYVPTNQRSESSGQGLWKTFHSKFSFL